MFTGIVEELGRVGSVSPGPSGVRLQVGCRIVAADAGVGASVSVEGVCLTVAEVAADRLAFDVTEETLRRTTLERLRPGDPVNLERPLTLASRLGGHLVQGHVDGVGEVVAVAPEGRGARMSVRVSEDLRRYVVEKGSVAVDGVSLTVASANGGSFDVALVPHTLEVTTLGTRRPGDAVNLETDVLAKYVDAMSRRSP